MSASLRVEQQDDVWIFVLQRPDKRNALSAELVEQMLAAVEKAHSQQARVIVFRGEGKNFSAGFDFGDLESQSEADLVLRFVRIEMMLQAVASSPCLTVGLAHGKNFGAGVDLLAVCRHRFATPDATFRMPGLKFGLVLGTRRFGDIVGPSRAASILEEAGTFGAAQALEMGFVHRLLERDQWSETVAAARTKAAALEHSSRAALYGALANDHADSDMAMLVRSAARPGIKDRVARYLNAG